MNAARRPTHRHSALPKGAAASASWRWLAHACLALLLLLTQQVAWLHGLSHGVPASTPSANAHVHTHAHAGVRFSHHVSHHISAHASAHLGTDHHAESAVVAETAEAPCLQCLAYSALANSLWQTPASQWPCPLGHVCAQAKAHASHEASTPLAYRSRAPPVV